MRFEYFIGLRYLRARRRERFVSLIALISLAGVTLGTFTLTVMLAVMSGFQEDLRQRLLAFTPHVTVERSDQATWDAARLERRIGALAGVSGAAPFVSDQVMAVSGGLGGSPGYVAGAILRGVLTRGGNPVLTELQGTLTAGGLEALNQRHQITLDENGTRRAVWLAGAVIGKSLAADLGLHLGDPVTLISPVSLGAAGAPRLKRFVVGGFFHSGMAEYDSSLVFLSLADARALMGDDSNLEGGLEVRVRNLFEAPEIARQIAALAGPGFEVRNWTETDANLFSALKLEKTAYFVVLLLTVLVAAFNIVATLVMVVMERRKEIAIVRAMGARAGSIAAVFLFEGAALGVVGTMLGVGTGYLASYLIGRYQLIRLPADLFMVSAVPVRLYPINFAAVAVAAIVLCIGAALYPALQARSLSPVEVIRYE